MGQDKNVRHAGYDYGLLIPYVCLLLLGLVAVYSASSPIAAYKMGDGNYFLKRQAMFCLGGVVLMLLVGKIPCTLYAKLVYPMLLASLGLLIALYLPGVGTRVGGAIRWIRFSDFSFQPSEFAKFPLAVYLAYSMAKKGSEMRTLSRGLFPHLMVSLCYIALIYYQPDLGTCVIIGSWVLMCLFVGGVRLRHLLGVFLVFVPVSAWLVIREPYRVKRLFAFMNPWEDPQGIGFQIIHSYQAFGSGGILGVGIGDSKQKLFYLPEPHTDFVLSIVAEEMGLVGVAAVIVLFGVLIARGIRISLRAPDLYSSYLAMGLTALIGMQVLVNMGVVMGLLPTKGLTLPLISYGGSSLIVTSLFVGVLLRISSRS
ncbi:MAG: putative lipid II flippase FtsW [Deltaproteobacteria bacterium]|nr:putative lipid II flippase FtsW [Deltaproteobacteria bacterium]MBW1922292.1 putative lipid II flippase FtsW [Deltaproteobacteria bacterium]MBW1950107.1 putative lipid II flippase FtsW [Deltaproteobacteria bacterium]MBW2009564.1 putative lipid II flippase FtsW [Deltaproteobacteria bacterium]MBW2347622.1 putative lipid II flippase FtsW [Deltaproteobacteria bacterium]